MTGSYINKVRVTHLTPLW